MSRGKIIFDFLPSIFGFMGDKGFIPRVSSSGRN